jgi:hypothetical protein
MDVPESWLRAAALGSMRAPIRGVLTNEQILLGTQHLGAFADYLGAADHARFCCCLHWCCCPEPTYV